MSSPNWNPHGFAHDYSGDSRPYVRRSRRPPPTAEPNTGALWEDIRVRLESEDSARMAWLSTHSLIPDPDEADLPPECEACGHEFRRSPNHPNQRVCGPCQERGYRSTPCISCGGITHKRDRASVTSTTRFRGMCGECRARARGEN